MNQLQNPELQGFNPEVFSTPNGEMLALRFDVHRLLETKVGPEWQERISEVILKEGKFIVKDGSHHTVREPQGQFGLISLEGDKFAEAFPGMWDLYRGAFKQMMQAALPSGLEPLHAYENPEYGLEPIAHPLADVTSTTQNRYEAHVDQRYTGVLVVDAPDNKESGGRLVISNRPDFGSKSIEDIDIDATRIAHKPGTLVCFSRGRFFPHYTEEITDPNSQRITVSLNYPVEGETLEAAQELLVHNLGKQND